MKVYPQFTSLLIENKGVAVYDFLDSLLLHLVVGQGWVMVWLEGLGAKGHIWELC